MKKSIFIILLTVVLTFPCLAYKTTDDLPEWTILVFMNADNNLEPFATINFDQMARVENNEKINVIVQYDRIGKYPPLLTPNWKQTLRFKIKKGIKPIPSEAIEDLGEANMGEGQVLSDFVSWGMERYPAKKTMLIIWDHGQGWRNFVLSFLKRQRQLSSVRALPSEDNVQSLRAKSILLRAAEGIATEDGKTASFQSAPRSSYRSVSSDETNSHDVLYNREIQETLKSSLNGKKIDIIGFDACLMAMIETAYAMKDIGNYMVASEELEPGRGWDYEIWLNKLVENPTMDAGQLSKVLVEAYKQSYQNGIHADPKTTLSAVDLTKSQALATSITDLSDALRKNLDTELNNITAARSSILEYAPGDKFYHIDLDYFLEHYEKNTSNAQIREKIIATRKLLSDMVIANYAGAARKNSFGSTGLAIYFPRTREEHVNDPWSEGGYEKNNTFYPVEFVQKENWTDFLHQYWGGD